MSSIERRLALKNIKIVNIEEYTEPYLYDHESGEYFTCIETMKEWYAEKKREMPQYAYGVYLHPVSLELDYILDNACDDHAEGIKDSLSGIAELEKAIENFNNQNKTIGSYYDDRNLIVKLF